MTASLAAGGPVWLLGAGNMGGALLARWHGAGLRDAAVIDPHPGPLPAGIAAAAGPPPAGSPAVLVLAVKPQVWRDAAAPLAGRVGAATLVVSIMAGVTEAAVASVFPGAAVVRAMPNTPARIGLGITALHSANADAGQRALAEALLAAVGETVWLDDEAHFDAVTAVSGSGPAYLFAFIEALGAAAAAAGLPAGLADRLALRTVIGAAALAAEPGADAAALRAAVTSPGGTTAAGLAVLSGLPGLSGLLRETVAAAQRRSRELGTAA